MYAILSNSVGKIASITMRRSGAMNRVAGFTQWVIEKRVDEAMKSLQGEYTHVFESLVNFVLLTY